MRILKIMGFAHIVTEVPNMHPLKRFIEQILVQTRWILIVFYLGLIVAQVLYAFKFTGELVHLCSEFRSLSENELMLAVLTLIDITMIANLIKMIIAGSYQSFVAKIEGDHTERVSSGYLKVKMGGALVGVSSIHLLQAFINTSALPMPELIAKCGIHLVFLISTVGLAYIDYLHHITKSKNGEDTH